MQYLGFVNLTPFAALPLLLGDERGADLFTFVVKGTFMLPNDIKGRTLTLADEQVPVCLAPVYNGEPEQSSLKYESETAPVKVGTDVVLIGHARAPYGRPTWLDVALKVGPAQCTVRVFGDRYWSTTVGKWSSTAPEPFDAMPLVYERAFGGWDRTSPDPADHSFDARNPVGVGFVARKNGGIKEGAPLPNLENPFDVISGPTDRPAPVGFGFVGAHWEQRTRYAGTYDDTWRSERMPLLPQDFDRRYYNAASHSLSLSGYLRGGEPVEIVNASQHGALGFRLPTFQPFATVRKKDRATERVGMALDTVILNTDTERVFLVWRGSVPLQGGVHDVLWSKVQLASTGVVR